MMRKARAEEKKAQGRQRKGATAQVDRKGAQRKQADEGSGSEEGSGSQEGMAESTSERDDGNDGALKIAACFSKLAEMDTFSDEEIMTNAELRREGVQEWLKENGVDRRAPSLPPPPIARLVSADEPE